MRVQLRDRGSAKAAPVVSRRYQKAPAFVGVGGLLQSVRRRSRSGPSKDWIRQWDCVAEAWGEFFAEATDIGVEHRVQADRGGSLDVLSQVVDEQRLFRTQAEPVEAIPIHRLLGL